jgi:hypothetical protein
MFDGDGTSQLNMPAPWQQLKKTELLGLRQRRRGSVLATTVSRLRKLVRACEQEPDSDASICYHGSLALIFEFDRDWGRALKHRRREISKIRKLYVLEQENPTNGYATQKYGDADLRERLEIQKQLRQKAGIEQGAAV